MNWGSAMSARISVRGSEDECNRAREDLLERVPGLIMDEPRKGRPPRRGGEQLWFCYGGIAEDRLPSGEGDD